MKKINIDYIKNRRLSLGITQQTMASKMGFLNSSNYLKYENGDYEFKANHLPILADTLNCKITDFFNQNVAKIATRYKN